MLSDHRQPWDGAITGAAFAGGAEQRESRLALFSSWIVVCFQFGLFLMIGVLLAVYYKDTGLAHRRFSIRRIRRLCGIIFQWDYRVWL